MQNLFVGGSSEIAKLTAKKLKFVDNLSRKSSKNYKNNFVISTYSEKNISSAFKNKINMYDNLVIFNGKYSNSFISNFNEKDFDNCFKVNLIIPLRIATKAIEKKIIKKNGAIFFVSSVASQTFQVGNAYYSLAKKSLEISANILGKEQRNRGLRINVIKIGIVDNKMGYSVFKYLPNNKNKKLIKMNTISNKITKILKNKNYNIKKINLL